MSDFNEQSKELQLKYFVRKKLKGLSFREISALFEKHNVDDEARRFIMENLEIVDRHQKIENRKKEKAKQRKAGITNILIGIGILIFGLFLYVKIAQAGVIFILHFIVWGFAGVMMIRGLKNLIDSTAK